MSSLFHITISRLEIQSHSHPSSVSPRMNAYTHTHIMLDIMKMEMIAVEQARAITMRIEFETQK